jgi:predicted metal-dependent hydrolase
MTKDRSSGTTKTEVTYSVSEVTVSTGKTSQIKFMVDDRKVTVQVPPELKAHFDQQFSRENPTPLQKRKYATLMNLLRAAYLAGRRDASSP